MKRAIPELFVPFPPDTDTTLDSFGDAINALEKNYSFRPVEAYLHDVHLDGGAISHDGKSYPANQWAVESLCKMCKVSRDTTYRLPPNYLIDLINNIVKARQEAVYIFMDEAQTRIVNIVYAHHYHADNKDVLNMFKDLDSEYVWDRKEIRISERGIELSLVTDMFGEIEPVVGDITKTGFYIVNSETGGRPLKASFLLFRLSCLNGAVLRDKWGEVRWTYDRRMSVQSSLKTFRHKLQNMQLPIDLLQQRIERLLEERLNELDFRKIWRSLSRIVSPEEADYIIDIDTYQRKNILNPVKCGIDWGWIYQDVFEHAS